MSALSIRNLLKIALVPNGSPVASTSNGCHGRAVSASAVTKGNAREFCWVTPGLKKKHLFSCSPDLEYPPVSSALRQSRKKNRVARALEATS